MRNLSLNAKSEKTASKILSGIISRIVDEECEIEVLFDRDAYRKSKAPNGQWAAII